MFLNLFALISQIYLRYHQFYTQPGQSYQSYLSVSGLSQVSLNYFSQLSDLTS